jgi:hypothetical protein
MAAGPLVITATPGNQAVTLFWEPVSGASGYVLLRSNTPGGPYAQIATPVVATAPTYVDGTVQNNARSYYVVQAILNGTPSDNSPEASATPVATPYVVMRRNAGFLVGALAREDDAPSSDVALGFTASVFGQNFTTIYVNPNGHMTFNAALASFTPYGLAASGIPPMIAGFFADVDTRNSLSAVTTYGTDTVNGHPAFSAIWDGVGYYGNKADKLNKFQIILISRPDTGGGNFDIEFDYEQVQWESGDASSGNQGFGGSSAHIGYTDGSGTAGHYAELQGSGVSGAFTDGSEVYALAQNSNVGVPGRFVFAVRGGVVVQGPTNLTAQGQIGKIVLNWSAPLGSNITYKVYRGTSASGESGTPIATGLTATNYVDTNVTTGVTYYYYVTSVASGTESASSNEAHASPFTLILAFQDAYTSVDGSSVTIVTTDNGTPPLLPSPPQTVTGLQVQVNGTTAGIVSALRAGPTVPLCDVIVVTLTVPVSFGDRVTYSYSGGNLTDSAVSPVSMPNSSPMRVRNLTYLPSGPFFDPLSWLGFVGSLSAHLAYQVDPLGGDVLEQRLGFPLASTVLDTAPPSGEVVLNEDTGTGGMKVHSLSALNASSVPLSGSSVIQDALGVTVRAATQFGGAANPNSYEAVGDATSRSVATFFPQVGGVYQAASHLSMIVTAATPKQYLVEIQQSPVSAWLPMFVMIASDTLTPNTIQYDFASPVTIYGLRVRYRGDYYAPTELGTVTVSASDPLSGVQAFQLSHYADFRDASEFPGASTSGWVAFNEGVSEFDWQLVNQHRVWAVQPGKASAALTGLFQFGGGIFAITPSTLYQLGSAGLTAVTGLPPTGATITCWAIFNTGLYIGLSTGVVLYSASGASFTAINPSSALPSITALASFGAKLWIGTAADSLGIAHVSSWDGTLLRVERTLSQAGTAATSVTSMCASANYLFVGVGGVTDSGAGGVYIYDGQSWGLTLSTEADSVDALSYATEGGGVWAGLSGGSVYTLAFDSTGKPTAWSRAYDGDSNHFLDFLDDGAGQFFWLVADTELLSYVASSSASSFVTVQQPVTFPYGLSAIWTNSDASNYTTMGSGTSHVSVASTQIDLTDIVAQHPMGVNTTYVNCVWQGFVVSDTTEDYTFYLNSDDGSRLYLNGALVIDNSGVHGATELSATFPLSAGQFVPIRVEYDQGIGGGVCVLSWSSPTIPKEVVPINNLTTSSSATSSVTITAMAYLNGQPYGAGSDGRVYALDTTTIASPIRTVYARFIDVAGNATPLSGALTDTILRTATQDATSGGTRVSDGAIYQIAQDKTVIATFQSKAPLPLFAPSRVLQATGTYDSEPFFVPTLSHWGTLSFLASLPAPVSGQQAGLGTGVEVDLYVRAADTQADCLSSDWLYIGTRGNIVAPATSGLVDTSTTGDFNIAPVQGKWLQYRIALTSQQQNAPLFVEAVTLTYKAAQASYFFTSIFDTSARVNSAIPPTVRRFLLTANTMPNDGQILFGYTTDTEAGNTFDFSRFTPITPNTVQELPQPISTIRFGILLVSVGSQGSPPAYPATVDNFAVQLDTGADDVLWMN